MLMQRHAAPGLPASRGSLVPSGPGLSTTLSPGWKAPRPAWPVDDEPALDLDGDVPAATIVALVAARRLSGGDIAALFGG
jgi:hypothetical protein